MKSKAVYRIRYSELYPRNKAQQANDKCFGTFNTSSKLTLIATGGGLAGPPHQFYQDSYQNTQIFSTKLGGFS